MWLLLLVYNDFNDLPNGVCPAFDTNTYNVSTTDDIDSNVNDDDQ